MDLPAFGSQDFRKWRVARSERRVDGESGCDGNAVREAHGRTLAMVATRADTPGLHAKFAGDSLHGHPGMAEQGQISFHAVRVCPEDTDHLIADFGGVNGGEDRGATQQIGYFVRGGFAA